MGPQNTYAREKGACFRNFHAYVRQLCLLYFYQQNIFSWIREHSYSIPLLQVIINTSSSVLEYEYFRVNVFQDHYPKTLLDRAAAANNENVVSLLIAAGANVDCSDGFPLRVSAHNSITIIQALLSAGAKVNICCLRNNGSSALEVALSMRHGEVARLLLHAGATCRDLNLDCMTFAYRTRSPDGLR